MVALPDELQQLKRFHGHLGPYVVIGYRMGSEALDKLQGRLHATVMTGNRPPISCIVDGIQFSASCTMGKGNINIEEVGEAKARFVSANRVMEIRLKDVVKMRIDRTTTKETEEAVALALFGEVIENLFDITVAESSPTERTLKLR
jgi:formylmethanofuran dehydrogenase subunit E